MTTLEEVLRSTRSEGAFENWGHTSKQKRLEESSSTFRASTHLRSAQAAIFEMDKIVAGGYESRYLVPFLLETLSHLASSMDAVDQEEAAGALEEVRQYLAETFQDMDSGDY